MLYFLVTQKKKTVKRNLYLMLWIPLNPNLAAKFVKHLDMAFAYNINVLNVQILTESHISRHGFISTYIIIGYSYKTTPSSKRIICTVIQIK